MRRIRNLPVLPLILLLLLAVSILAVFFLLSLVQNQGNLASNSASQSATLVPSPISQAAPTATRTPLPIPTLPATPTPVPTPIRPSPTPSQPITAWRTYTNTTYGYVIEYPNTWFLQTDSPDTVFVTSFQMSPPGRGSTPSGSVKMDILVSSQVLPTNLPAGKQFCVNGHCGTRVDQVGPFSEPIKLGLNRTVYIQISKAGKYYGIAALIADPESIAVANSSIVERIIASFRFTQ